jgi:hypothetical protein
VTGVYVFANGEAKVHWTEKGKATEIVSEKTKKTEKVLNYEASEGYLQYRTNVAPNPGDLNFYVTSLFINKYKTTNVQLLIIYKNS